jgi:hypothetical protein
VSFGRRQNSSRGRATPPSLIIGSIPLCNIGGGSKAWIRVVEFLNFAIHEGRAAYRPLADAAVGDVIVADWQGRFGRAFRPERLLVVNGVNNPLGLGPYGSPVGGYQIRISEHSKGRRDIPLRYQPGRTELSTDEYARQAGHDHPGYKLLHVF